MGSPFSPIVANVYMEDFEAKALSTSPHPPSLWKRYVDDPFLVIKSAHKSSYLDHIYSVDQCIQFTGEDSRINGSIPFLDILVICQPKGSLNTTVYKKHTRTVLYLQWDNHHTISAKYSMVSTLHYRARAVFSSCKPLPKEEEHLHRVLERCKYLSWDLKRMKVKIRAPASTNNNKAGTNTSGSTTSNNQRPHMVVPYTKG